MEQRINAGAGVFCLCPCRLFCICLRSYRSNIQSNLLHIPKLKMTAWIQLEHKIKPIINVDRENEIGVDQMNAKAKEVELLPMLY
ncbi:hypothetical protein CDAR_276391 [Caerostris darwini]|uniref:Uncharacterized protein n=1 Tax=Caerostris darwini TaxID=1538125 RepID=A0AAV4QFS1_9ARAC|nr:hypothetical protein CDAR_276391 [Caerostris darwini]